MPLGVRTFTSRVSGLGTFELERLLGCPEHHMQFHIWYLRENGWIQRMDNGKYAVTVTGVDKLVETDIPWRGQGLLPSGAARPEDSDDRDENSDDEGAE